MWGWTRPPRIIGHRGSPREAPENTLPSFEACVRAGVPAIETDARLTDDGEVVLHHDAMLPNGAPVESLRDCALPKLADALRLPLLVDLELKPDANNASQLPAAALKVVRGAGAEDRVLVTSFDPELADAYARLSGRPAGMILPFPPEPVDLQSFPRLTFIALVEDAALPEVISDLKGRERQVLVWTVNAEESARRLFAWGADGIITDRPALLARAAAEAGPGP